MANVRIVDVTTECTSRLIVGNDCTQMYAETMTKRLEIYAFYFQINSSPNHKRTTFCNLLPTIMFKCGLNLKALIADVNNREI